VWCIAFVVAAAAAAAAAGVFGVLVWRCVMSVVCEAERDKLHSAARRLPVNAWQSGSSHPPTPMQPHSTHGVDRVAAAFVRILTAECRLSPLLQLTFDIAAVASPGEIGFDEVSLCHSASPRSTLRMVHPPTFIILTFSWVE
jgi:hypothetical protein